MCTQSLHLYINVLRYSDFCANQEAHTRYSLVDMGFDAITHGCRWSYTIGRMAREYLGSTCNYRYTLWTRQCLVCLANDA